MTSFRVIAGLVIVALLAAIFYDLRRGRRRWSGVWRFVSQQAGTALQLWRRRGALTPGGTRDNFRRIASLLSGVLFLLLALTGFVPVLFAGDHLSGALLIIHVTAAPLFAVSLSALALLWAHRLRFGEDDWQIVLDPSRRKGTTRARWISLALKIGFWLILVSSLPLMGSIILSLFPLYGTQGQEGLMRIHGYSALLMLVVSVLVVHLTIASLQNTSEQPSKENPQ